LTLVNRHRNEMVRATNCARRISNMKKNLATLFGALMALTLLASACGGGGDDPSAADQAVIDAIAAQIGADGDAPAGLDLNCMASAMVDGLGGTQVMADSYGLTAETIAAGQEPDTVVLSVEDARTMGDASMDCGMGSFILAQLAGDGMAEDDASCLLDKLDQDAIRDMFAAEFMSEADADRIGEAAEDTMLSSIIAAIGGCDLDPTSLGL